MEIFYTGEGEKKLMSIFYSGNENTAKKTGIIICNPLGNEYIRFYKTISILAKELSQKGYPTCRFDYYGTGDSYGDEYDMDVKSCKKDLKLIMKEMLESCVIDNICLIGIRYGGFLSMLLAEDIKVNSVVLWNPIFSGKDYLDEILLDENEYLQGSFAVKKKQKAYECMGFIYSDNLVTDLKKFNINHFQSKSAGRVLIIADKDVLQKNTLNKYAFFNNSKLKVIENSVPKFWLKQKGEEAKSLVPVNEIKQIIEWLKS